MSFLNALALLLATSACATSARAIPESVSGPEAAARIESFMASAERFDFAAHDGIRLSGVRILHPEAKGTVVVVNGRTETWLKYGELFLDLHQRGFSVYSYDHRGQGLSPRLIPGNTQIGYVENFDDYVLDLRQFMDTVVVPGQAGGPSAGKIYALAHSLGGAITTRYQQRFASPFKAVALSAPLYQLFTRPASEDTVFADTKAAIEAGRGAEYVAGRGNYNPNAPFEGNPLSTSLRRWAAQNQVSKDRPQTIVAGASNRWTNQTIVAGRKALDEAAKLSVPMLILQAGNDVITEARRQDEICSAAKDCEKIVFPASKHHILMEQDTIRDEALDRAEALFTVATSTR